MAETKYVVFEQRANGDLEFRQVAVGVPANSPKAAIRKVVEQIGQDTQQPVRGRYAATPERSWKVEPVDVEIQTRIKVG
jgi:hypothetical protein